MSKIKCETLYEAIQYTFNKPSGLYNIQTDQGIIEAGRGAFGLSYSNYVIYNITIKHHLRGKHIWSNLLRKLAENNDIDTIVVFAVSSHKMDQIMSKLKINNIGFVNYGGDFVWKR